ncbi:PhzF family phenazine biosynthesis protein [Xylophilus sp. ASV27]|uniref:PhzF family phenazine biosynthesis protein n=1 Tax=Xylophilus sp. ASV27 TaxID=2795129 RepID=UPI0018EE1AFA|nr:PhzF family phenazine biosynthesis protein [Xylophilus sp. ASV27]
MKSRPFEQIDVFSATPYRGNPLAVVPDGSGLDDAAMQRFAAWTNLSETTFLLPPTRAEADYRVRIFTPAGELPFAGHPTLGSCHVWLSSGGQPRRAGEVVQESAVGLVRIRRGAQRLAFAAPPLRRSDPAPAQLAQVARALGLKPQEIRAAQLLDNGPLWLALLVDDPQTVLALTPDHSRLRELGLKVGVVHLDAAKAGAGPDAPALLVRAFAAPVGVAEDPVTGSLNAALAQWLIGAGMAPSRYVASQGECLGRAGRIFIEQDAEGTTWVGGDVVTCITGRALL